ncbi:MAG: hypothetical protein HY549_01890 [Elusimicrobia bacterium]|nr:hypothetical protein [Elusimicrobiota bacterium]
MTGLIRDISPDQFQGLRVYTETPPDRRPVPNVISISVAADDTSSYMQAVRDQVRSMLAHRFPWIDGMALEFVTPKRTLRDRMPMVSQRAVDPVDAVVLYLLTSVGVNEQVLPEDVYVNWDGSPPPPPRVDPQAEAR